MELLASQKKKTNDKPYSPLNKFTFDKAFLESINPVRESSQVPPPQGTNRANDRVLVGTTSLCEQDYFKPREIMLSTGELEYVG